MSDTIKIKTGLYSQKAFLVISAIRRIGHDHYYYMDDDEPASLSCFIDWSSRISRANDNEIILEPSTQARGGKTLKVKPTLQDFGKIIKKVLNRCISEYTKTPAYYYYYAEDSKKPAAMKRRRIYSLFNYFKKFSAVFNRDENSYKSLNSFLNI